MHCRKLHGTSENEERDGEKEEGEPIKIARRSTMFREDNIFPPWAKITRMGRDGNRERVRRDSKGRKSGDGGGGGGGDGV